MAASASFTVVGIKDTLRELQKLEPDLAKEIKRDFKQIVDPIVKDARVQIVRLPLSGFGRKWRDGRLTPWSQNAVSKSIIARFSNRKRGNSLAVFSVTMKSPIGTVFDMAGRSNANRLGQALSTLYGAPSRLMWPTYEKHAEQVNDNLRKLTDKLTDAANRRLAR